MFRFVSYRGRAQVLLAVAGLVSVNAGSAHAITLDEITIWTGTGENRAGLVIEWGDSKSPVVYGYQFDGTATGEDMLLGVIAERPELYCKFGDFNWGRTIFGLGIDRDADGFAIDDGGVITPDTDFTDGAIFIDATQVFDADGGVASDADDSYGEGWFNAYFQYFLSDGVAPWAGAQTGFTGRTLTDGDWDAYVYAPGFVGPDPSIPVPEPTSAALFVLAGSVLMRRRRHD